MKITKPRKATCAAALAVLGLLLIPEIAMAAMDTGVMDTVMEKYEAAAKGWGTKMVSFGSWLFWGLAIISMVWTYGMMALRKADIGEFFAETIRFFGTLGFFWWILINGPAISKAVINSMWSIGADVAGGADKYSPSGITDIGFNLLFRAFDSSSRFSPIDSAVAIVLAAGVLVVLTLIAVNMLLLFVSSWLLMYGGAFLLGFGGARWTSDIAITFYKTVLGVGVQLMTMILLIGVGKTFIDQTVAAMDKGINLKEMAVLAIAVIILLYLTNKLPPMLAAVVGGAGTGGIGGFGAGTAVAVAAAAAGVAAGMASAGASLAAGGAANMAGAGSALKAAFQSAQENMASDGGGGGGGGGGDTGSIDGGGSENGGGGGSGGSSGGGGSSFGQAMGTAGRFAADMAGSLAGGAKSSLAAKGASMAAAANERISNTVGGKLAAEINGSAGQARDKAQVTAQAAEIRAEQAFQEDSALVANHTSPSSEEQPAEEPKFEGNSVSGRDQVASNDSANDEINDFVNGKA
ncbi:P-type conjugative transfer protein TrbL [Pseudomonas sp. CFBP 13602]|uniref:P-type conjugative transfer protein TrbL n=1 Tax=Pseudomonas sp. CFBP 13602 TaxID=2774039 RepID=UPI00177DFC9F|nr:P-type conjugative transfer protein TrbL [Pseudomonas sp. CFBP 13602]MBD8829020.1 P-type conjugative transfer protein TrbL [Pseudomonas sp. CFBP 13602]